MSRPRLEYWSCCECDEQHGTFCGEPETCARCGGRAFEPAVSGDDDIANFLAPLEDAHG